MSAGNGNGVIRIGRKGVKKFAFGDDGEPFEVDVVYAFQQWVAVDESLRQQDGDKAGEILTEDMPAYHQAAVQYVQGLIPQSAPTAQHITIAEALDFIARLREQYDELVDFFRPKRREKDGSPGTLGAELVFSEEAAGNSPPSTN